MMNEYTFLGSGYSIRTHLRWAARARLRVYFIEIWARDSSRRGASKTFQTVRPWEDFRISFQKKKEIRSASPASELSVLKRAGNAVDRLQKGAAILRAGCSPAPGVSV